MAARFIIKTTILFFFYCFINKSDYRLYRIVLAAFIHACQIFLSVCVYLMN